MKLNTVEELLEDIRQGKMIILMDDEDRENEGDLVIPASKCNSKKINFMCSVFSLRAFETLIKLKVKNIKILYPTYHL